MRNVHDLLLAEKPDDLADYGGWWFFAFAIKDVEHYPFPFFVRGDDITFGLMNKFNICTMLGISVWGDDFSLKSGPMTYYLDTRYHIFLYMILFNHNPRKIIRMVWKFFYRQLTSYNYASASAITQAINHISEGPKFFRNNMKMEGVFPLIQLHPVSEKLKPVIRGEIEPIYGSGKRRRRVSRLIQKISFNGALLPNSKFKADTIVLPKGFSGDRDAIYRIRSVLYEYDPLNLGYIVSFRRDFFFREMFKYLTQVILFRLKFSWLHKEYKKELTYLTSKRFWKETYIEHGLN